MTALELLIQVAGGPAAGQAIEGIKNKIKDLGGAADSFKLKLGGMDSMIAQAFGIGSIVAMVAIIRSAINETEKYQNALKGLASVARYSNEDIGASIKGASKLAADGLMTVQESAQGLKNLMAGGMSLEKATTLMARLKDQAAFNRQAHYELGAAVVATTEGIKNENSVLSDATGTTKNIAKMYEEYAKSLNRTTESLTQAEKLQAAYNGFMKESEASIGNATLAANGLTGAKAKMGVEILKLKVALGETLTPAFLVVGNTIRWVLEGVKAFIGGIEIVSTKVASFLQKATIKSDYQRGNISREEAQRRLAGQAQDEQAQIDAILNKWNGNPENPNIGADNGKRRDTSTIKAVDKAAEAAAKKVQALIDRLKELTAAQDSPLSKIDAEAEKMRKEAKGNAQALILIDKWQAAERAKVQGKYMDEISDEMQKGLDEEIKARKKAEEEQLKIIEELYKAEIESADARASLEANLTEANATEYQKRLQAVDKFEKEQLKLAFESFTAILNETGDAAKAWEKYEALKTEITAAAGKARAKVVAEETAGFTEGAAAGFKEYYDSLQMTFDKGKQMAIEFATKLEDTLVEMFDNPKKALKNLGDYFMATLKRMVAQAIMNPIMVAITGTVGGGGILGGGSAGGGGAAGNSLLGPAITTAWNATGIPAAISTFSASAAAFVTGGSTYAAAMAAGLEGPAMASGLFATGAGGLGPALAAALPVLLPLVLIAAIPMIMGAFKGDDNLGMHINPGPEGQRYYAGDPVGSTEVGSGWTHHNAGDGFYGTTDNMGAAPWALQALQQFKAAGKTVKEAFENLGLDVSGFAKEFLRNKEWKAGEATPEAMQAQLTQWFGEWMTEATNIDFSKFAKDGEALGTTVIRIVNALTMLGSIKDFDVAAIFDEIPTKAKTMQEALRGMDTAIGDAVKGLEGLTGQEFGAQLELIGSMLQQRYQAEIQYLTEIKGLQESLHLAIAAQIDKYAQNSMTLTQRLSLYHDRIITDWNALQATNDPALVSQLQATIAESVDNEYQILTQLKGLVDGVGQLISGTLESYDVEMMSREEKLNFYNSRVQNLQTQYNDPNKTAEEKAALGQQIVEATRAAWSVMTEEEKRTSLPLIHEVLDPISADMTAFSAGMTASIDVLTPALQVLDATIQGKLLDAINTEITAINNLREVISAANLSPLGISGIDTGGASSPLVSGPTVINPPPITINMTGDMAQLFTLTSDYTINVIRRDPGVINA